MRKHIKDFVGLCADRLNLQGPVYDFGAMLQGGQDPALGSLCPCFPGRQFWAADFMPGPGVEIVLDLHHIDLPDETAGTAISVETFEHVQFPWIAIKEMHRILKPDGVCILSSVMHFPIHNFPDDYWRYTPSGFRTLLEYAGFQGIWVDWAGSKAFPHTVVGLGFKGRGLPGNVGALEKELRDNRILWQFEPGYTQQQCPF